MITDEIKHSVYRSDARHKASRMPSNQTSRYYRRGLESYSDRPKVAPGLPQYKLMENPKVLEQVTNNSKKQAMIGGFVDALNTAAIDSLDAHKRLATQTLCQEKVRLGLANIVYDFIRHSIVPSEDRA